jgi:hypothetical protein
MSQAHAEKINAAINRCLDEVCSFEDRTVAIGEFVRRLRNDPRWLDWEIDEVEEAVHHTAELIASGSAVACG